MPESGARTVRVRIDGRVQRVGYRAWTERAAADLGLTGWVRNRQDGSVEAVFQGRAEAVAEMLERCREGPAYARVVRVAIAGAPSDEFEGFELRPTE